MNVRFTYEFNLSGRTAETNENEHIRNLIEQVLFTTPGERLNRPTFGTGLMQLVFQPNNDELSATLQFLVQGALQQWLGNLIEVNAVEATNEDATLRIVVMYTNRRTQQRETATFTR